MLCWSAMVLKTQSQPHRRQQIFSSPVEIFPENYGIDEQFGCQVADRGPLTVKRGV